MKEIITMEESQILLVDIDNDPSLPTNANPAKKENVKPVLIEL
jgi:hypothetical protein